MKYPRSVLLIRVILIVYSLSAVSLAGKNYFPSFADAHTIGLWLFDEKQYPCTTLTDASQYEYDLRLQNSGELIEGKFGNALKLSVGEGYNLYYAEWKGKVSPNFMRAPDDIPSGLWGPTIAPKKLIAGLAGNEWTCEFWLKLSNAPKGEATIIDLGKAYDPGFTLNLASGAKGFTIENSYGGFTIACPTDAKKLSDGKWHHVAITVTSRKTVHYLDGKCQLDPSVMQIDIEPMAEVKIPKSLSKTNYGIFDKSRNYEFFRQHRFNMSVGENRKSQMALEGAIDELRFSDVVRYCGSFKLPESFSRSYGPVKLPVAVKNEPDLLFIGDKDDKPVKLGSRKHLFIDEVMIDSKQNVKLKVNPPVDPRGVNIQVDDGWFIDHDEKVYMFVARGYGSSEGITRLYVSDDGVKFDEPKLGAIEYKGTRDNNLIFYLSPMYGCFFKDTNPNVLNEERFKVTAWSANRGIYMYSSPDMIHWRRNETIMLPVVSGGNAETFWDGQQGRYVSFLKRDGSYHNDECPTANGRVATFFETTDIRKPWPFHAMNTPYFEGWPLPALTCEGPIVFGNNEYGQVYRTRAIKYPWALDVYLAFLWRMNDQNVRQTELAVSRDGTNWKTYANIGMYMPNDGLIFEGDKIFETLAHGGLIRRGDNIWQYAQYVTGAHGGGKRSIVRLTQRLDGFVSLDAGSKKGTFFTRLFVFDGSKLILNADANNGYIKVELLNQTDKVLGTKEAIAVTGDSVEHVVRWNGNDDVSDLAGKVVRLKIEMQNAKLFSLQFQ